MGKALASVNVVIRQLQGGRVPTLVARGLHVKSLVAVSDLSWLWTAGSAADIQAVSAAHEKRLRQNTLAAARTRL